MKVSNVLVLPGWQSSGPAHWQSLWERQHGYVRVEQHDWMRPLRGDWIARLQDMVLACDEPPVLVAHSLGCALVAAWAALAGPNHCVKAALLVAPGDPERDDLRAVLHSWSPVVLQRLPFRSVLVGSRNDPYCSFARAQQFANAWGSEFIDIGERGHINAESALGNWPQGQQLLADLMDLPAQQHMAGAAGAATNSH